MQIGFERHIQKHDFFLSEQPRRLIMENMKKILVVGLGALSMMCAGPLLAANPSDNPATTGSPPSQSSTASKSDEMQNAQHNVTKAANVIKQLTLNPNAKETLSRAKAAFIVPEYARASFGIGGAGGEGVLVANNNGKWSAPAFYNIGAINLGLEAGAEAGQVVFLIMSEKALEDFKTGNNFALNADAGLTIVNWTKRAEASTGQGPDVIVWASTKGLYGDLAISVSDIFWDGDANSAYYQRTIAANEILSGNIKDPMASSPLKSEFSALESGK
jgi:lipid-binding SYLF domain-containing protein